MPKRRLRITVEDKVFEVEVEIEEFPSSKAVQESPLSSLKLREVRPSPQITTPVARRKGEILAPMAGRVLSVKVRKGQKVRKGEIVVILESMKTQVEVKSPLEGVVKDVLVKEGQSVRQGDLLVVIS